jgi:hypothetical protein
MNMSQYCRFKFSGMLHCAIGQVLPDVSKEFSDFVFRVKQPFFFSDCLTLKVKVL